jgi:hypothetical protein
VLGWVLRCERVRGCLGERLCVSCVLGLGRPAAQERYSSHECRQGAGCCRETALAGEGGPELLGCPESYQGDRRVTDDMHFVDGMHFVDCGAADKH